MHPEKEKTCRYCFGSGSARAVWSPHEWGIGRVVHCPQCRQHLYEEREDTILDTFQAIGPVSVENFVTMQYVDSQSTLAVQWGIAPGYYYSNRNLGMRDSKPTGPYVSDRLAYADAYVLKHTIVMNAYGNRTINGLSRGAEFCGLGNVWLTDHGKKLLLNEVRRSYDNKEANITAKDVATIRDTRKHPCGLYPFIVDLEAAYDHTSDHVDTFFHANIRIPRS